MHPLECRTDARIPFPSFFWRLSLPLCVLHFSDRRLARTQTKRGILVCRSASNERDHRLSVCLCCCCTCMSCPHDCRNLFLPLSPCMQGKEGILHSKARTRCPGPWLLHLAVKERERENAQTRIYQGCLGAFLRTWSKERRIPVFDSVGMQTGIGVCADHWASACCNRGNRLVEMHTTRRCIIPACTQCTPKGAHS